MYLKLFEDTWIRKFDRKVKYAKFPKFLLKFEIVLTWR